MGDKRFGLRFLAGKEIYPFPTVSGAELGHTNLPIQELVPCTCSDGRTTDPERCFLVFEWSWVPVSAGTKANLIVFQPVSLDSSTDLILIQDHIPSDELFCIIQLFDST
jgi:hypothetical protein